MLPIQPIATATIRVLQPIAQQAVKDATRVAAGAIVFYGSVAAVAGAGLLLHSGGKFLAGAGETIIERARGRWPLRRATVFPTPASEFASAFKAEEEAAHEVAEPFIPDVDMQPAQ